MLISKMGQGIFQHIASGLTLAFSVEKNPIPVLEISANPYINDKSAPVNIL